MLYIDVTELSQNPLRTGIQRVTREILRHWPKHIQTCLCVYNASINALVELSPTAAALLREDNESVRALDVESLRRLVARAQTSSAKRRVNPLPGALFVPELFYDRARCEYYLHRLVQNPKSAHFLLFDFIPWLQPGAISVGDASRLMWYLRVAQAARSVAFISAQTRNLWARRIVRDASLTGPVVPLGSDGLPTKRQSWNPLRASFVCLGSLDGRRNQDQVLRAFETLWSEGSQAQLEIFGHVFDASNPVAAYVLERAPRLPLLQLHRGAADADVAAGLSRARATIFASSVEGFGLPPVESLWAGVPAIVTHDVPSIQSIEGHGVVRIQRPCADDIAGAVRALLHNDEAERHWRAAETINLPRWSDMVVSIVEWLKLR